MKCTQYKSLQGFYTVLLHIYPEKVYQYINNRFFVLSKLAGINFMLWNEVYPKSRSRFVMPRLYIKAKGIRFQELNCFIRQLVQLSFPDSTSIRE